MAKDLELRDVLLCSGEICRFHAITVFYPNHPEKGEFHVTWDADYEGEGPCYEFEKKGNDFGPVWNVDDGPDEWKDAVDLHEKGWVVNHLDFQFARKAYELSGSSFHEIGNQIDEKII